MFILCRSPAPPNSRNDVIWPRQVSPDDHLKKKKNVFVMVTLLLTQSGTTGFMFELLGWWTLGLFSPLACRKMWTSFFGRPDSSSTERCHFTAAYLFFFPQEMSFDGGVRKALITRMCCELTFWSLLRTHLILWIYIVQVISLTFSLKCNILKT